MSLLSSQRRKAWCYYRLRCYRKALLIQAMTAKKENQLRPGPN
jgi:hypothetical protein